MYLSLSRASESLVMIGASEFLPIYIENQFILPPNEATTLAGRHFHSLHSLWNFYVKFSFMYLWNISTKWEVEGAVVFA